MFKISLLGQKFGKLTVVDDGYVVGRRRRIVKTKCECGNLKETPYCTLMSRKRRTRSCGCIQKEKAKQNILKQRVNVLPYGISAFNALYSQYKLSARKRGFIWELSKEIFKNLTKEVCFYCGKDPLQIKKTSYKTGEYIYNGIDRINNNLGYSIDNCVACCLSCNIAKNNLTIKEFEKLIINISSRIQIWAS